jgi:ADP-ribosylglycohydrolase
MEKELDKKDRLTAVVKSALFGVAVGDALGVPVEFVSREELCNNPVTDMRGYGSHNQPAGTWSDDSSLTFCLADALTYDFNICRVAQNCTKWVTENFWTALHGLATGLYDKIPFLFNNPQILKEYICLRYCGITEFS